LKKAVKTTIIGHACEPEVRLAVCKVKNRLRAVCGGFMREVQQIPGYTKTREYKPDE
jgi:hypothetical protein